MTDQPKNASEAFVIKQESIKKRSSQIDIGMGVGNALTNAVNLVICLINNDPSKLLDPKDIEAKIKEWTDKIFKIGQDKKDYESIPVDIEPVKQWNEHKQKIYEEDGELQEVKELNP